MAPETLEIGRTGAALRAVAGDDTHRFAAMVTAGTSTIEAHRGAALDWHVELDGSATALARTGALVVAAVSATRAGLRGEPAGVIVAVDATSHAVRWRRTFESTRFALIAALAPAADGGVIVGGAFAGTLRAADHVVESAGDSDGFVARLSPNGDVAWLVRLGGAGADAVQGVATAGDRIALAGTFTAGADLLGAPLTPYDERLPSADAFVAELDASGARKWVATFSSKQDDTVAGVAIDASGRVVVAATVRDVVHIGPLELVPHGAADGLVAWFGAGGAPGNAVLLGGLDFDGLRAITTAGDRAVVAGFFSGTMPLGARTLRAGGGDDAFLAALDPDGHAAAAWQVGGPGREEISSLAAVPGGFLAGVAHTATLELDDARLPAPADPMSGAALVVRAAR